MAGTEIEIEYCVPCGFLNRAMEVCEAVLTAFGDDVDRVSLVTGRDGVFEVRVDGDRVFEKHEDEYDVDAIVRRVRSALR